MENKVKTSPNNNTKNNEKIACTICEQQFGNYEVLKKHRQRKHRDVIEKKVTERKFECETCGATFKEKRYNNDHTKRGVCTKLLGLADFARQACLVQKPIAVDIAMERAIV
jgi:hypothetical protein